MEEVLREFFEVSGQRINVLKSKLFVSRNTEERLANRLSHTFEVPLTKDLGIYLGMLII